MNISLGLATALLAVSVAAAQADNTIPPVSVHPTLELSGAGDQIYVCKAQTGSPTWTFVAPQAVLFEQGREVGTHGAGPTWTLKDGGYVKGQILVTAPSPDTNAIPWLLLKTSETNTMGRLAGVKYIRRSNTVGGIAQTTGCDASHLGATILIPYKATYTFYSAAQ